MKYLWAPWRIRFLLDPKHNSSCPFCELPKQKEDRTHLMVHRAKHCFIILNKYPYNSGHVMVIPYQHTCDLQNLSDEVLLEIHQNIRKAIQVLQNTMNPEGFNVGMNLGQAGGAGIRDHLHYHVVPRWNGDTNFIPVIGDTKVLPQSLEETFDLLHKNFS
jgi:ATP adenylyltransferase